MVDNIHIVREIPVAAISGQSPDEGDPFAGMAPLPYDLAFENAALGLGARKQDTGPITVFRWPGGIQAEAAQRTEKADRY